METWIKEAFEKAISNNEKATTLAIICGEHLDKRTTEMLDVWGDMIGMEERIKFARLFMVEKFQDAMAELTKIFFVGGYCAALDDVKLGKMKV